MSLCSFILHINAFPLIIMEKELLVFGIDEYFHFILNSYINHDMNEIIAKAELYIPSDYDSVKCNIIQIKKFMDYIDLIIPGYRRCVCGVDSIFYKMNEDIVEIMTIIGRQDLNQLI